MDHNKISAICRRLVAQALSISEDKISVEPWDRVVYDFAKEASQFGYPEDFVEKEFKYQIGKILETPVFSMAAQRHHDYYIFLYRQSKGKLSIGDMRQYDLAMERERDKEVRSLPKNAGSPFG